MTDTGTLIAAHHTTTPCARGCLIHNQHTPGCTCSHECGDHKHHCNGCLPRPAEIGHYCQHCAFHLRDTIDKLPPLIETLWAMPGGQTATPDTTNDDHTRRATKVDQHSPSPAHDTADEGARWVHSWAIALANDLHETGPFKYRLDGTPSTNTRTETAYLTSRLAQLCARPYANDLGDEAKQLVGQLTRATGTDQADQRIPAPCPQCGRRTLMRPNGEEYVTCRNRACATVWQSDHLGWLAREVSTA